MSASTVWGGAPWTPLLQAAIAESSEAQYKRGVEQFLKWLQDEGHPPLYTVIDIDNALCEYAWWIYCHFAGRGRSRLHNAIYGIEHYLPRTEKQLVLARRSEKGWKKFRPPLSHPPLNWGLTCLIAEQLARGGHPGAAVAVLVGVDCYLRISEIGSLRACDISVLEGAVRDGTNTLVSLAHCKTGDNQSVVVRRESVSGLLVGWKEYVLRETGDPYAHLFPDPAHFRHLFTWAQRELGWSTGLGGEGVRFVPHSLRHGGASVDYISLGARRIEEILFRGRWASMRSTRHYIQQGPALTAAALAGVPQWQREFGLFIGQGPRYFIPIPEWL